jgi:cob(I)alamin adenosyltransferase
MAKEWKIYTKTGDKGETSLIGGSRVPKFHNRIEAYGTLDELNSFIGHLRDQIEDVVLKADLLEIQDRIFTAEALLATDPEKEINQKLPQLCEADVIFLEDKIDLMNKELPEIGSFLLPGGHPLVSLCHICRTVCRRAERLTIKLAAETVVEEIIVRYLNRLSDYFFVLARKIASDLGVEDVKWKARI